MSVQLRMVQAVYGALIGFCGVAFLLWSRLWPSAMDVGTYGYAAYDTDAEIWSLAYVSAGMLIVVGALAAPIWVGSVAARVAGFGMLLMMSCILAMSAWHAPNGAPVVIFSALFFAPAAAIFAALTVVEYRRDRDADRG
jgi:hypothetical protein